MPEINDFTPEQGLTDEFKTEVLALQDLEYVAGGRKMEPSTAGKSNMSLNCFNSFISLYCNGNSTISSKCYGSTSAAAAALSSEG